MKAVSIVGTRPEFIQCHTMVQALGSNHSLIHTGQHYDYDMSQVFFEELELPQPVHYLEVGSETHNRQIALMLLKLEAVLPKLKPDWVLVYGDTNTTLAGAMAAVKLGIPVCHIEAGLRSFNRKMPEEINRIVVDHIATLLCYPTRTALTNLANEGLTGQWVGDVTYDAYCYFSDRDTGILNRLGIKDDYYLLTLHRSETIPEFLTRMDKPVIFPVHPGSQKLVFGNLGSIQPVEPVSYLQALELERNARLILTDSGGVQKEAYFAKIPCVTLRDETEWIETVEAGWNRLNYFEYYQPPANYPELFGDGKAGERIAKLL